MSKPAPLMLTDDVNFLAYIAHSIENACGQEKRYTGLSSFPDKATRRQADILDSLAHILVAKERNQVIAVGALLAPNKIPGLQLVIAENRPVLPEVKPHLENIFVQLQNIHNLSVAAGHKGSRLAPTFNPEPENEYQRALAQLETDILTYSWAKIGHRFSKNGRNENVIETIREIYGLPANEREDFSKEDQDHLGRLQSATFVREHATLRHLESQVVLLGAVLSSDPGPEHTSEARLLLYGIYKSKAALESETDFMRLWDLHIERYIDRLLQKQDPSKKAKKSHSERRKTPNTLRWLSKVVSIFEHYLRIADIATSASLSALLLGGPIKTINVGNLSATSEVVSLDSSTLRQVLAAADCEIEDESIAKFFSAQQDVPGTMASSEENNTFERKIIRPVHCECQLLAHIHTQPAIPYIGVSKLSCAFCDIYFEAYRAVTDTLIYTRGSHGQTTDWRSPTLDDAHREAEIRPALRAKLLELISTGWTSYRRGLRDSQSTDASGEETRDTSKTEVVDRLLEAMYRRLHQPRGAAE
ncbi:hypothetical protein C8R47DRAFT_1140491 [Mycena vitilis]|nr:hypothetical protein C8R47DRAFT_1140491 [Mycena vitilis]